MKQIKQMLRLVMLVAVTMSFTNLTAFAQNYTLYKGKKIVANSIIVKYDKGASAVLNGKTISALDRANEVKAQHSIKVKKSLSKGNIEVWNFSGSIDKMLAAARSIPGAIATPNYVHELPKVTKRSISAAELDKLLNTPKISSSANPSFNFQPASAGRSGGNKLDKSNLKAYSGQSLKNSDLILTDAINVGDEIVLEDFESPESVDNWTNTDERDGAGTLFGVATGEGGSFMLAGDMAGTYLPNSLSKTQSPLYDLSGMSMEFGYELSFNFASAIELDHDYFYVQVYYLDENDEVQFFDWADLSKDDGMDYSVTFDLKEMLKVSNRFFLVYGFESDDQNETGFGAAFDNLRLVATEKPITNDPYLSLQWALNNDGSFYDGSAMPGADIGAFNAWNYSTGSKDVNVVVFDTGVDINHPDLNGNLWVNPGEIRDNGMDDDGNGYIDDIHGWDAIYEDGTPEDGDGHGSHVSGIIGAVGDNGVGITGINQVANIINVRIFDEDGFTTDAAILGGYDYISALLDNGVSIAAVNQSWGGGIDYDDPDLAEIVGMFYFYANHHGMYNTVWVVSAGNSSLDHDNMQYQRFPDPIQAPNIISVASTDAYDGISDFSDYGKHTVEVGSPGSDILSTVVGGWEFYSGTSMASPYVTGTIALAASVFPNESASAKIARVMGTSDKISSLMDNTITGGRLNAYNAISAADKSAEVTLSANPSLGFFNRVDWAAQFSVGFTNTTGASFDVTGLSFSGPNAENFSTLEEISENITVMPGYAFGVGVIVDRSLEGVFSYEATLTVSTSNGSIDLPIMVSTQKEPIAEIDNVVDDQGRVVFGQELTSSFTVSNSGRGDMNYEVFQGVVMADLEMLEVTSTFKPEKATKKTSPKRSLLEVAKSDLSKVAPALAAMDKKTIKLDKDKTTKRSSSNNLIAESELYYFQDFNDTETVNWTVLDYGEGDVWNLTNLAHPDSATDNVFFAGDFENGYQNSTLSVAISPMFDFTSLSIAGESPYYLLFNYSALLEDGYDFFYVNVLQFGSRIGTFALTGRDLANDGEFNLAVVDIRRLAGMDGIEFMFVANYDAEVVEGFGAMFDNFGIATGPAAFFVDNYNGSIAEGSAQTFNVTARTGLIGTGPFLVWTDLFTDAVNDVMGYGPGVMEHLLAFEATYNPYLSIEGEYIDYGSVSKNEPMIEGSFSVTNNGPADLDYLGMSLVTPLMPEEGPMKAKFFGDTKIEASAKLLAAKTEKPAIKKATKVSVAERINAIRSTIKKPSSSKAMKSSVKSGYTSRLTGKKSWIDSKGNSIAELNALLFETFDNSTEMPEGWDVIDVNDNGYVWNVASIEEGQNVLAFGDFYEGNYGLNTMSIAFSPYMNFSSIDDSQGLFLEMEYSALIEPFYDDVSVFIGTDADPMAYPLGSTNDMLVNDGFMQFLSVDLSSLAGLPEDVYLTFVGTSDESFSDGGAFFDNIAVYTDDLLAYVSPRQGQFLMEETAEVGFTINSGWLYPGMYRVFNTLSYTNHENIYDMTYNMVDFEIINNAPIAGNDTLAVVAGDVINIGALLDAIMENDTDEDGDWLYVEEVSQPVYGNWKRLDVGADRWWWNGATHYVAPLNYDGMDMFTYMITDGFEYSVATVHIKVMEQPEFVTGVQQQFSFLEDNHLMINTMKLASGVGGMNKGLHVWAKSHHDAVHMMIPENEDGMQMHAMDIMADENFFGQVQATFYVSDDIHTFDSLRVTFVIVPVNDMPTAGFEPTVNKNVVSFADLSNDNLDPNGGIIAWAWDFGNGQTSEEQNPVATYDAVGEFTVTLVVTDNEGATAEFSSSVDVVEVTSVEAETLPTAFEVFQNYPNPFNPSTQIKFAVPSAQKVSVEIFNIIGQRVAVLANGQNYSAGFHSVTFDASKLSSGTYIYRVMAKDANGNANISSKSMILIK